MSTGWRTGPQVKQVSGGGGMRAQFSKLAHTHTHTHTHTERECEGGWMNQKELYCQVCLHTQGIWLGVINFQYKKVQT